MWPLLIFFWHPKYTYERARQAGVLIREVVKFRKDAGHDDWPCVIGGDFNFAPDDPAYSLLVGDRILPTQEDRLTSSRVVHLTVDADAPTITAHATVEEDGDIDGTDASKIIAARPATPSDGLLTTAELIKLYATPVRSAYDEGLSKYRESTHDVVTYSDRVTLQPSRLGANEPQWTSYTHYWKTVLDYIFILDPTNGHCVITGFSQPHTTENLKPGIPRKGICGSDHVSLSVEILM